MPLSRHNSRWSDDFYCATKGKSWLASLSVNTTVIKYSVLLCTITLHEFEKNCTKLNCKFGFLLLENNGNNLDKIELITGSLELEPFKCGAPCWSEASDTQKETRKLKLKLPDHSLSVLWIKTGAEARQATRRRKRGNRDCINFYHCCLRIPFALNQPQRVN